MLILVRRLGTVIPYFYFTPGQSSIRLDRDPVFLKELLYSNCNVKALLLIRREKGQVLRQAYLHP